MKFETVLDALVSGTPSIVRLASFPTTVGLYCNAPVGFEVVIKFASVKVDATVISPFFPDVLETRLSREPLESVRTPATTPMPAALIAAASPARFWAEDFRSDKLKVCAVPPFTAI